MEQVSLYRFSRPFSSPLHSISSIFYSISSREAYCVQILSSISSNCHSYSFLVNKIEKFSIQIRQLSLKFVSAAKRVTNARIKFVMFSNKFIILTFKFVKYYWAFTSGRRFWMKLWRKWTPIDEINFAVSCSATVTDEFEFQLTKTGDKARNWMTMFQNWSTKDEIETSIRTFHAECPGRNWKHMF